MFTGIIESIGTIVSVNKTILSVKTPFDAIKLGESISVNGICLTVTKTKDGSLTFDFSPETAEKTTISDWRNGTNVNLERALKVGDRLGGHFVTGHVDGIGVIEKISKDINAVIFTIKTSNALSGYFVAKGSVSVDGISLTIADRWKNTFSCAVIPHTLEQTALRYKNTGDLVNLETDILAKQIANFIAKKPKTLSEEFLKENGFF